MVILTTAGQLLRAALHQLRQREAAAVLPRHRLQRRGAAVQGRGKRVVGGTVVGTSSSRECVARAEGAHHSLLLTHVPPTAPPTAPPPAPPTAPPPAYRAYRGRPSLTRTTSRSSPPSKTGQLALTLTRTLTLILIRTRTLTRTRTQTLTLTLTLTLTSTNGLYALLDSACRTGNSTGQKFCASIHEAHTDQQSKVLGADDRNPSPNRDPHPRLAIA